MMTLAVSQVMPAQVPPETPLMEPTTFAASSPGSFPSNFKIPPDNPHPNRLHGRAFYKSIGSPKYILAPMVEHSHLAWRILVSRHLPKCSTTTPTDPSAAPADPPILSYTPMLHSRLYHSTPSYPVQNFPASTGTLDGTPRHDRPLFAQFCANDPAAFLSSAKLISPYVDAIDLNLGCPQGIARKGHYGSFLQDEWELIHSLISTLHDSLDLPIPITAKIRIFKDKQRTLDYARMVLSAGASVLAVHGRTREQKGHNTGLADWDMIRFLRNNLPAETVLVANGNLLWPGDADKCLSYTGADAVMSAEGCLYNPTGIFLSPTIHTPDQLFPRMDMVAREYLTILRTNILPYLSDSNSPETTVSPKSPVVEPNLTNVKSHLFKLLHCLLPRFPAIRQRLATSRPVHHRNSEGIDPLRDFEQVVSLVEEVVREELEKNPEEILSTRDENCMDRNTGLVNVNEFLVPPGGWVGPKRKKKAVEIQGGQEEMSIDGDGIQEEGWDVPWYRCQPNFRPLPEEAVKRGAMAASFLEEKSKEARENSPDKKTKNIKGKKEVIGNEAVRSTGEDGEISLPISNPDAIDLDLHSSLTSSLKEGDFSHVSKKIKLVDNTSAESKRGE